MKMGLKMRVQPPQWLRGPASVDGSWLVVDASHAEQYSPYESRSLAFDLARVDDRADALGFVQRYGLLKHGTPDNKGRLREALDDFLDEAHAVHTALTLAQLVQSIAEGDPEPRETLRELEPRFRIYFEAPAKSDDQIAIQASRLVAWMISGNLDGVEHAIESVGIGRFALSVRSPTLLGYVYSHLASVIVERAPLRRCRECGAIFAVEDERQQYCRPTCSKTARQRRWVRNSRIRREETRRGQTRKK